MKKKLLSCLLILSILLSWVPTTVFALTTASGTVGDGLTWTLDTGVLTITGSGTMDITYNNVPWEAYKDDITKVVIGSGAAEIGDYAFSECPNLAVVEIADTVTNIGSNAFYHCSALSQIEIPDSVTTIERCAFYYCTGLTSITIPENVSSMGELVFSDCTNLISATFCDGVTSLGEETFANCVNLLNVVLPGTAAVIGNGMFNGCSGLVSITVPEGITEIDAYGFQYCDSMVSIILPKSLNIVGYAAFLGCDALADVYYTGSESEWNEIEIGSTSLNSTLTGATIHYNYEMDTSIGDPEDFNVSIYRAYYLQDTTRAGGQAVLNMLTEQTPSQILYESEKGTGFADSAALWTAVNTIVDTANDPTYLGEFVMEPKDIYSALILSSLHTAVSSNAMDDAYKDLVNDAGDFVSTVYTAMETTYALDVCDDFYFHSLNTEQKQYMQEVAKEWFDKKHGIISTANSFMEGMTGALEIYSGIEDYFERMASCVLVANLQDSMQTVLRQMYQDSLSTSNTYLQLALQDCVDIIDSSYETLFAKIVTEGTATVGMNTVSYLINELWWNGMKSSLYATHPAVAVLAGAYEGGKLASNILFSTDATIEAYLDILAILDIQDLFITSYQTLSSAYATNKDAASAANYLSAIDFLFALKDQDCAVASNFVETVDQTVANRIVEAFNKSSTDEVQASIQSIREGYSLRYLETQRTWIYGLWDDYPNSGLYETYEHWTDELLTVNKEFTAACPVNVYVYDESEALVASIEDGMAYSDGAVLVSLAGETKTIRFYDDSTYRIVYKGYDEGSMDVTIQEFNDQEALARTVNFYDVPLTADSSYEIDVDTEIINSEYVIGAQSCDYDSMDESETHTVSVRSGYMILNGVPALTGTAAAGQTIALYANIPAGHQFLGWTAESGTVTFADNSAVSTTFIMPDQDIVLIPDQSTKISGSCGDSVTWSLENGVLTISGAGTMSDYWSTTPGWYAYRDSITSVIIESGVTSIGHQAFLDCYALESVEIANTVTAIDSYAFVNCTGLLNISVDAANTSYKDENGILFDRTQSTLICYPAARPSAAYTVPDSVTSIGSNAFRDCTALTSITIPSGVTSIGWNAFENCSGLTAITLPDTVTELGSDAFGSCTSLTEITLSSGLTDFQYAFSNCTALEQIVIPDGITKISTMAFNGCANLESITLPVSIAEISYAAFSGCDKLKTIYYLGTKNDMANVMVAESGNDTFLAANVYCLGTDPCAAGHSYNSGSITKSPTCTAKGVKTYTCTVCGNTKTAEIAATGHSYVSTVTAPTCTTQGYTTHTCSTCGDSYKDTYVSAAGHSYNAGVITKAATCTANGVKTYTCTVCGNTKTAEIAATGHNYTSELTTAPTYTATGLKTYTCTRCGDSYTEPLAKLQASNPFTDVKESNYFYNPVMWAVEEGITTGTAATTFTPNGTITREQFVTFLWRMAGKPEPNTTVNPFTDVKNDQWHSYSYKAILWAYENGITTGTSATTFSPNGECTRAQVVAFLWRYAEKPAVTGVTNKFTDVKKTQWTEYYYDAVLWAVQNGITTGATATTFRPDDTCTRAQCVTFLYRYDTGNP